MRIKQPSSGKIIELADWFEAFMIVRNMRKVSRSQIRRHLRSLLLLDGDDLELQIEFLIQELNRRREITGISYPFDIYDNGVLAIDGTDGIPYIFLLCLSTSEPLRSEERQSDIEILFDVLVMDALRNYLSGESKGVHFGWPTSGNRPPTFPAAIDWLAKQLGLQSGKGDKRIARRDGGVDVVVWRPFRDLREGFVTILGQCTIAIDWTGKAKDIIVDLWRGYIDFGKDPIICLAIPFVIPTPFDKWDELRCTVDFVLDRLRICELLEGVEISNREEIENWANSEIVVMKEGPE